MAAALTESQFWSRHVRNSFPGYIERIESLASLGVPDTFFTTDGGLTGWIELKVLRRVERVQPNEVVNWGIRREQATWHWRWARAQGISLILVAQPMRGGVMYYWFHGCYALRARMMQMPVPFYAASNLDWKRILRCAIPTDDVDVIQSLADEVAGCA
jgi:hypothetical protein